MKISAAIVILLFCAVSGYAAAINRSSETVMRQDSLAQLASRCYNEGDYQRTIAVHEAADSLSRSPRLLFYAGMSSAALYDYPHALEYFQKAILGDSVNVNYRFQLGRLLIQAGFLDRAANELSACTILDSTYLPAWYQLGLLCSMQKNDPGRECEIFSFLIRQNPHDFLSLYYLGDALRRSGAPDSGIMFIRRSIALNPEYYPSLVAAAHYFDVKKQYAPALEHYKKAMAIRPHDKDLLFQTAECLRKSGALNDAVVCFKKAIAIDSTNDAVHAQLGYAYYSLGRFDSSVQAYAKAIALNDDNVNYYRNIALAYQKMDSVEAAIRMSMKAIDALHPENIAFAYTSLAAFYSSKNRPLDAVSMYKKNIADAYMALATYYHSNNMRSDAITAYQHAIDLDPAQDMLLFRIAGLYEEMNENKSAIRIYKKLLQSVGGDAKRYFEDKIESLQKNAK